MGETDLISRQAAIEEIARQDTTDGTIKVYSGREVIEILRSLPSEPPKKVCVAEVKVDIDDIKDYIDKAINAERWIPCSERLPEEYGEYLITWETSKAPTRFIGFAEGEETGEWDDEHDRFVFSWLPEDYIIEKYPDWRVIAWMPLPEPYREEQ